MATKKKGVVEVMEGEDTTSKSGDLMDEGSENADSNKKENGKKRRIIYTKAFLVKCFRHPLSTKKPQDFPLSNLDCTLTHPRIVGKNPLAAVAPKRKDESVKKEIEIDDTISLRPQRATFSSGCAPNLSPNPNKYSLNMDPHNRSFTERDSNVPRATTNSRFNFNNQRTWNDNVKSREVADTFERLDRERQDRDRERDRERFERDRFRNADKTRQEPSRVPPPRKEYTHSSWTSDPEPTDWGRRRGNERNQNNQNQNSSRSYGKSGPNYKTEEEPEWYSVPMSHNDTIELCGLPGDVREGRKTDRKSQVSNGSQHVDSSTEESLGSEKPIMMDFSILGAAGLDLAEDEPITSKMTSNKGSRFTDFFASQQQDNKQCGEPDWRQPLEEKKSELRAEEMTFELRNFLSISSDKAQSQQPSVADRFNVPQEPPKTARSCTPQEMPKVVNKHVPQQEPTNTMKNTLASEEKISFEKIIGQLVEKGTKKTLVTNEMTFNPINAGLSQAQGHTSNTMTLPRSRPGSCNGPSTVEEMYADPLHPFTQLVRHIHNGVPMGVSEFIPRDPTPTRAFQAQAGNPMVSRSRRQSAEESLNNQRKLSQAAQEYHASLQRELKGKVEDMQGGQRSHHMDGPPPEFDGRNGQVHIPQPIYRVPQSNSGFNGAAPVHQGAHFIDHNHGHGPPMVNYIRPQQYGPGPINSYSDQSSNHQAEFTPAQVMSYLPYDIQCLISSASPQPDMVRRPELIKCLAGIRNGEITLHDLIGQLSSQNQAQRQMMAMILKFCFQGHLRLRGLSYTNPYRTNIVPTNVMPGQPPMMPMPMMHHPHHQFSHGQPPFPRAGPLPLPPRFFRGYESQPNAPAHTQVPATMIPAISIGLAPPTSSVAMASMMAFTPTAVMRQMTAGPESRNPSSR